MLFKGQLHAEVMLYITEGKINLGRYSRSSLSRRLDKYTNNINEVISAVNQIFQVLPHYSGTFPLLKLRGGHVTCSDRWNLNCASFLSRNLRVWVICYALLPFTIVTDNAPDGDSSTCLAARVRMKWSVTDLPYKWELNGCFKPLKFGGCLLPQFN